jgi:hypothetical protein
MPVVNSATPTRRGAIRGRQSRNQTLTTELTEAEQHAVERAARADGKTIGEWLRDLALQGLQTGENPASGIILSEIAGARLLLANVLRSLGTGQKLTPEAFDKLLDEISTAKHDLAGRLAPKKRR